MKPFLSLIVLSTFTIFCNVLCADVKDEKATLNPALNGTQGKSSTRPKGDSFAAGNFINQRGNVYNWDLGRKRRDVAADKKATDPVAKIDVKETQGKNFTRPKGDSFAAGNFINQGGNVYNWDLGGRKRRCVCFDAPCPCY